MNSVCLSQDSKTKVEMEIFKSIIIYIIIILLLLLSFYTSILKPDTELSDIWFQRSGSIGTILGAYMQYKITNLLIDIRGTVFAESWVFYNKYQSSLNAISWAYFLLISISTMIWGYGDIVRHWAFQ
jgi:hypothetical protein